MEFMRNLFGICGYGFLIICMFYIVIGFIIDLVKRAQRKVKTKEIYDKLVAKLEHLQK